MNVNGIGKQAYYKETGGYQANRKKSGNSFYESLSENIDGREQTQSKKGNAAGAVNIPSAIGHAYPGVPVSETQGSEAVSSGAVSTCEARCITYQESSFVKTYALQGFTLMAQVDMQARSIYVEQRMEDGTVQGYVVDRDKLGENPTDPVERTALEAWEETVEKEAQDGKELTVEEALLQFYEFIEDRIKNGPPKYQIGKDEFSIAEWEKLLESIDDQLDAIREEMRERIEKMKEQMLQAEAGQEQVHKEEEEDVREKEEELLASLFQDKGIPG
ncbi:MAG: hypothetical protein NC318_02890 [Blautia sp.]|nr:hypothetical protein [Lachnoclostridium sp.]MCM1210528.1 hypothetical protein [Blautia sp.]